MDPHQQMQQQQMHQQQQMQQQQYAAVNPNVGVGGGYAYYAAPQYNYNAYAMNPPPMYHPAQGGYAAPPMAMNGMAMGGAPLPVATMDRGAPVMPPPLDSTSTHTTCNTAGAFPVVESITVHDNDVLMGRGGKNNQHTGNERLRDMARAVRDRYKASQKKGKSNMSRDLVQEIRDLKPPGRFLKRNPVTNEWEDVGDDLAREKVSQVLRDAVSEWTGPKAAAAAAKQQEEEQEAKKEENGDDKNKSNGNKNEPTSNGKPSMLPPLPPPPPEINSDKNSAAAPKLEPLPISSNGEANVNRGKKEKEEILPIPTTVLTDADTPELPNLDDDLEDLPPDNDVTVDVNLLLNDASFLPDDSLIDNDNVGRDRFLSDMSFNDGETSSGAVLPMRLRSDTDDSFTTSGSRETNGTPAKAASITSAPENTTSPITSPGGMDDSSSKNNRRRPSLKVPVAAVPWNRNKRKTSMLDRYSNMSMGLSSSDMSMSSIGSLSSRNLGAQLSSRQLMSTGARQMSNRQLSSRQLSSRQLSSRQLSSRQLSSRQLSSRQLSSRQLSGRQLMSADQRKQNFAMMGESDLSLDALSISGDTNRSLSRKNIFMDQYLSMDMGLSDFSLGSMAGESMLAGGGESVAGGGGRGRPQRPSIIIEGDLEDLSQHGGSSNHTLKQSKHGDKNIGAGAGGRQQTFSDTYNAIGMGTSSMTMNTIGTFSGHSRRGVFASTGNSMRIESGHSFMTMGDLQLDMLDDELFDEFGTDDVIEEDEFGTMDEDYDEFDNEFSSDFI